MANRRKDLFIEDRKQKLCISCQKCCNYVTFTLPVPPGHNRNHIKEFYTRRGFEVIPDENSLIVVIKNRCPQLTKKGCSIYNKRPLYCNVYDGRNDPVLRDKCKWTKEL